MSYLKDSTEIHNQINSGLKHNNQNNVIIWVEVEISFQMTQ